MKVIECADYNQEFPESFPWGHIDSIKMCNLASIIVTHINHAFTKGDRNNVPGLRLALNLIAGMTDY